MKSEVNNENYSAKVLVSMSLEYLKTPVLLHYKFLLFQQAFSDHSYFFFATKVALLNMLELLLI